MKKSVSRSSAKSSRQADKSGYVYFILNDGLVKIGRTNSWKRRIKQFKTTMPNMTVLEVIPTRDMFALEKHYHSRYSAYRQKGEWFSTAIMKDRGKYW